MLPIYNLHIWVMEVMDGGSGSVEYHHWRERGGPNMEEKTLTVGRGGRVDAGLSVACCIPEQ